MKHKFFFLSWFTFTDTDDSQDSRGWEETIFYSTLLLPPAHEHSDIYFATLHLRCYHIFLIAPLVFTSLILDEIYHLVELLFELLMMRYWFLFVYLLISFRVWLKQLVWCHNKLELPIIKTPQSQCSGKLGLGSLILSMN